MKFNEITLIKSVSIKRYVIHFLKKSKSRKLNPFSIQYRSREVINNYIRYIFVPLFLRQIVSTSLVYWNILIDYLFRRQYNTLSYCSNNEMRFNESLIVRHLLSFQTLHARYRFLFSNSHEYRFQVFGSVGWFYFRKNVQITTIRHGCVYDYI